MYSIRVTSATMLEFANGVFFSRLAQEEAKAAILVALGNVHKEFNVELCC